MAKSVACPDGTVIRGRTDDELVAGVEAWLARVQPRLAGDLTRDEILARAIDDDLEAARKGGTRSTQRGRS